MAFEIYIDFDVVSSGQIELANEEHGSQEEEFVNMCFK